jgi:hypothetical protein
MHITQLTIYNEKIILLLCNCCPNFLQQSWEDLVLITGTATGVDNGKTIVLNSRCYWNDACKRYEVENGKFE